jgi:hypothetical protein
MPRPTAPRALAPLRQRGFRLLTIGQVTSNVGDACYAVALPWYVLAAHGGVLLLDTVLAAYGVPRTAVIAVGGYASDRWRPQTVMMATDAVRALALAALAVTAATGPARAVVLVPIAVVIGALVVRHWGPAPFFLIAAATLAVAILAGLSQRAWHDFGASQQATPESATHLEGQPA